MASAGMTGIPSRRSVIFPIHTAVASRNRDWDWNSSVRSSIVHGGKTATALGIVPPPELVTTRLLARRHGDENPEWPVLAAAGRDGQPTYRWPSNVRRGVRAAREQVGLGRMTPHTWRRTYATILDDEMSLTARAKADLMGQAKFLKDTYVSRG